MNAAAPLPHRSPPAPMRLIVGTWLVALTIAVATVGWRGAGRDAPPTPARPAEVSLAQWQAVHDELAALQAQVRALAEAPASASTAALQALRDDLEARLMQWEQTPRTTDVDAAIADLRNDITLLKAAQRAPIRVPTHAPAATPPIAPPAPPPVAPFPYRVLSLEQRAGFSSVSLAPATGPLRADQIQVVLPGETLGAWRLEAIEGDTVLFRNGAKSWRAALPGAQPKR